LQKNCRSFTKDSHNSSKGYRSLWKKTRSSLLPLHPSLSALKAALEAKNMKEIDKLLAEIEQLSLDAETREQINAVSDKVLMGEYAEAINAINTFLEEDARHED
jgi:uncharacterized protein HemY